MTTADLVILLAAAQAFWLCLDLATGTVHLPHRPSRPLRLPGRSPH